MKCPLPCLYTYHTHSPFICNDANDDDDGDTYQQQKTQERDRDVQGWALVCDTLLTRAASPGTVFQVSDVGAGVGVVGVGVGGVGGDVCLLGQPRLAPSPWT